MWNISILGVVFIYQLVFISKVIFIHEILFIFEAVFFFLFEVVILLKVIFIFKLVFIFEVVFIFVDQKPAIAIWKRSKSNKGDTSFRVLTFQVIIIIACVPVFIYIYRI